MEEILKEYISHIRVFENLIKKKYNLNKSPCIGMTSTFEKRGDIDGFVYWFHGTGCTVEKKGVIYAYDISIFVKDEIEFSLWEFSEFIRTHPDYGKLNYDSNYIEKELAKLIDKGILSWLEIEGRVFKTYRVL